MFSADIARCGPVFVRCNDIASIQLRLLYLAMAASISFAWFPSSYPNYCSEDMSVRQIPPLTAAEAAQVATIQQLQVVIRHGARTPYALFSCWENYNVTWNNCNVTDLMLASPSYNTLQRPAPWLFRKLFDGSANFLGGNCLTGQLILKGYDQEQQNGLHLHATYFNASLPQMRLFETDVWEDVDSKYQMYLRSDNEERTLMSGQILMHTLFNVSERTIVLWHTGDYALDQIYPNSNVCPRLNSVESTAYAEPSYVAYNTSEEIESLTKSLSEVFGEGYWSWDTVLDCLMTTVCTNRDIPDSATGLTSMSQELFNATVAKVEYDYAYPALFNGSLWSQLAMGHTAWHIRRNLLNIVNGTVSQYYPDVYLPLKFALFSGHDTTVMPLLAAILGENWDQQWAPYASLISFELYNRSTTSTVPGTSGFLTRIVYNGVPQVVPGCDSGASTGIAPGTLCDVDVLLDILSFARDSMPCSVSDTTSETDDIDSGDSDCMDSGGLDVVGWSLLILLFTALGTGTGAAGAYWYMTRAGDTDKAGTIVGQEPAAGQGFPPAGTTTAAAATAAAVACSSTRSSISSRGKSLRTGLLVAVGAGAVAGGGSNSRSRSGNGAVADGSVAGAGSSNPGSPSGLSMLRHTDSRDAGEREMESGLGVGVGGDTEDSLHNTSSNHGLRAGNPAKSTHNPLNSDRI